MTTDHATEDFFQPRSEQGTLFGNATKHLPEPPTVLPDEKIVYTPAQVEAIKRIAKREPRNPYRTGTTAHALFDQFKAAPPAARCGNAEIAAFIDPEGTLQAAGLLIVDTWPTEAAGIAQAHAKRAEQWDEPDCDCGACRLIRDTEAAAMKISRRRI